MVREEVVGIQKRAVRVKITDIDLPLVIKPTVEPLSGPHFES